MVSERGKQKLKIRLNDQEIKTGIFWKPDAYSITFAHDKVYTFLRDGRLFSGFIAGEFFQRGLNNQILHKGRDALSKERFRKVLSSEKAFALSQTLHTEIQSLENQARKYLQPEPAQIIKEILTWTPEKLAQDGERFQKIYAPISILPPDQYLSIVLQLTLGCSYNRCNFCNFYKNRPFQIKDLKQFEQHLHAVNNFLGASNPMRKGIFLADGDALMTPQKRLIAAIKNVKTVYPDLPLYAFMDAFRPGVKSVQDWRDLQKLGLKRVYFGIESADQELISFLNKPGKPSETLVEVQNLKAAGISLGLIFMIGAGGKEYAKQHLQASMKWLTKLEPDREDMIFLSEFIPHPDQPYSKVFQAAGLKELNTAERQAEVQDWLAQVKSLKARAVPYHLQEFIY